MEDRLGEADRLLGVFSDTYCQALYSQSERWAAYWQDPGGRDGFLVPIEVKAVTKWPVFIEPLKRLSLVGLEQSEARKRLLAFLEPPQPPVEQPAFPGAADTALPSLVPFTEGGDTLGNQPPDFPSRDSATSTLPPGPDLDAAIRCINDHEPKPEIFGREGEVETIVAALLAGKPVMVAGGPGMGKTAVGTVALYDPRVAARFGRRRIFASLEAATEPRAILAKLVEALGLPPTGDEATLLRIIEANATERPFAAILDNAETVLDIDRVQAERLLNLLVHTHGLSLVVTIRGVSPLVSGAVLIDDLPKLAAGADRKAFVAVAGAHFDDDPDLFHLLDALDGHALSIHLVAAQAIGSPSLKGLRESWDEAHAEILRMSGESESRLTSVRASLALSLNTRRMRLTPMARRLLALLAYLPGGLAEADVRSVVGERGTLTKSRANDAVVCLRQLRLVERRPDQRLRMLTPLRECVKSDVSPLDVDRHRFIEWYLALAAKARTIGSREWELHRDVIDAECDNLDSVCELAIKTNIAHRQLDDALGGLTEFHYLSGRGTLGSLDFALARLRSKPPSHLTANCIRRLGRIARARSDHDIARTRYEEALALHRRIGDVVGEANCILSLGHLARVRFDHEPARTRYEEALALYRRIGNVVGEANCIQGLGDLAHARSDHETARTRYEEALALHRRIGDLVGEANCIQGLGELARVRSDYEGARARYEEALVLYRRIGNRGGEAETLVRRGQVRRKTGDAAQALIDIEAGFAVYFAIADPQDRSAPGWQAMHRALTSGDAESQNHREQARSAWTAIGRLDLVSEWVDEAP